MNKTDKNILTINDIQQANRYHGQCWFNADTMRFHGTTCDDQVYHGPGGIYFVTRDKTFDDKFAFTVRQFISDGAGIDNGSELCGLPTKGKARTRAKQLAAGDGPQKVVQIVKEKLKPFTYVDDLLFILAKNNCEVTHDDCKKLISLSKQHCYWMTERCNKGDTDSIMRNVERVEKAVEKLVAKIGATGAIFSGDPRGCTVKLTVETGETNDMGREGICVPTSEKGDD